MKHLITPCPLDLYIDSQFAAAWFSSRFRTGDVGSIPAIHHRIWPAKLIYRFADLLARTAGYTAAGVQRALGRIQTKVGRCSTIGKEC